MIVPARQREIKAIELDLILHVHAKLDVGDGSGAVREIAAAGSRADAEVLAGTLEAKGSRHTFWVAARR